MAESFANLSLHLFALQEASQWDLRTIWSYLPVVVLVVILISLLLFVVPVAKLLRRTGHHPLWCILFLLPVLNLGALWFFAFKPWPTDQKSVPAGS